MTQLLRSWTGLRDGPFPVVQVDGDLSRAQQEWLHTNGAGAYSMSTVALMHTRRTHGLLVAALDPPLDRFVMLSHGETSLEVEGKTHRLSTHQFPDIAPTPGYRFLQSFSQDPVPRWIYRVGEAEFERTLALVRGLNAVVLRYRWSGPSPALLALRPLMPFRHIGTLMREHGTMVQSVALRPGEVEIQPMAHLPPILFRHRGVFLGSPDWWRRFEYTSDRQSGLDYLEDMWTPGAFELRLEPDRYEYLVVSLGKLPDSTPAELMQQTIEAELGQDPGPSRPRSVRALSVAAAQFCVCTPGKSAVLSGYPWLDSITRDALVSLPGLCLARGQVDRAKEVLDTLLRSQRSGLLPFRLPHQGEERPPLAPDATLWLFECARAFVERTGVNDVFVRRRLYPALRRAFVGLRKGRKNGVWITADGLLANGLEGVGLTWMDARVGDWVVTPRRGLAVELQALWIKGAETLAKLARAYGHAGFAAVAEETVKTGRRSFAERFWCNETEYPFDCVSEARGTAESWADASIRPNAVVALAIDEQLFDEWQAATIIGRARDELLTPRGLRSLSNRERHYRGHYEGTHAERDASYHQGTAWTHLLGCFVQAALRLDRDDFELREELRGHVESALDGGPVIGQVAQLADGDAPHRPRGCPAQAWSVGELLRALVVELGL
jgi:predicted glycogen debranching enzyme